MRRALGLLLVVLLSTLLLPWYATGAPSDLPGDFMGMVVRDPHYEWNTNPDYPDDVNRAFYDAMGRNLESAGVKWVRFEFRAEDGFAYDPENPLSGLRLEQYDYFVNKVAPRHGLKIVGLLATNLVRNPGYRDPEEIERFFEEVDDCESYKYGCGTNLYMRIWLDRAFAIADRYQNRIAAYEVMNEENRYIAGGGRGISPERMATLLAKFYRVFKVTGPKDPLGPGYLGVPSWRSQVQIVLGGIHPNRCSDCLTREETPMTDRQYLDAIYKSAAFRSFRQSYPHLGYPADGIGYHPYPMEMLYGLIPEETATNELYRVPARLDAMRQVMIDNGDIENKIWVTEIGDRGSPHDKDNQQRQADFLRTLYWMLWQKRDYVSAVFWFKYEDFAIEAETENWGVVRLIPRTPTTKCPTCEYDVEGLVEVYKLSYQAYKEIATTGEGLQTYTVFLPVAHNN